jgi:ABC-type bacteriocin/lantibiotic exporter with double-glycine peptidase domain
MNIRQIQQIIESIAESMNINFDPHRIRQRFQLMPDSDDHDLHQLLFYLNEVGTELQISFLSNTLSRNNFAELLNTRVSTILVFRNGPEPLIILPVKIKGYRTLVVQREKTVEKFYPDLDTLIADLAPPDQIGAEKTISTHENIFCIIPLLVRPLSYSKSLHNHPGSDDPHHSSDHHTELTPLQRLWRVFRNEQRDIYYIYIYAIIVGILNLSLPLSIQAIVQLLSGGLYLQPVALLIAFVVIGTVSAGLLEIYQLSIVEILRQRIFARGAFEFAFRIPRIRIEALLKYYAPELMNRFFDILTLQKGISKILTDFITAVLQIILGLLLLSFYHPFFIIFGIILAGILYLLISLTSPQALKTNLEESKYKYKVAHWLEEIARTLSTFKLAGYTSLPLEKMDYYLGNYLYKRKKHFQMLVWQWGGFVAFKTLITGGLLILGAILVIEREISLGQFVASEIIIILMLGAIEKIIHNLDIVYDLLTSVEKLGHVTDLPLDPVGGLPVNIGKSNGYEISVEKVYFTYPGAEEPTLKGVDLYIPGGSKIGIVGPNGSGRSTLINVLTGLLNNYEGVICYNQISMRDLNINSLRDTIGDNLTHEDVFEGTIAENVSMCKPGITLEDIQAAIDIVGLTHFIHTLPEGINTHVLSGGKQFSASIVKKIILARSVVEKPKLMVFDDFFHNLELDYKNKILDYIMAPEHKWTIIGVSNDPVFLRRCDTIALMVDGQIIQTGKPDDMFKLPKVQQIVAQYII